MGRPVRRLTSTSPWRSADLGEVCVERGRIDPQRLVGGVDEMRDGAAIGDRVGRGDEREGRCQHLVAGLHAAEQEGDVQGGRAVARGDRLIGADDLGQHLLEPVDVAAHR